MFARRQPPPSSRFPAQRMAATCATVIQYARAVIKRAAGV